MSDIDGSRFLTLADVAEILKTSPAQVYALVRRGELRAIKIGGRGQWRVEAAEIDRYIAAMYKEAALFIREHPFAGDAAAPAHTDATDELLIE